jgi:hypothetical protein
MLKPRQSPRRKSFLRGRIYFNNGHGVIDCLIRDMSEHGARLSFSDFVSIPDNFELHIPQTMQTLRAAAQWRRGIYVGVVFVDGTSLLAMPVATSEIPAAPDLANLSDRAQRIEDELAEMRRVLQRLGTVVAKRRGIGWRPRSRTRTQPPK